MPRGGPIAARIRAAHGYSDLDRNQLAEAIGLSARQLGRMEAGEVIPDRDLRERIADVCGVPAEFLETGFEAGTDVSQRIGELEALTAELAGTLRRVVADTAQHRRLIRGLSGQRLAEEREEDSP